MPCLSLKFFFHPELALKSASSPSFSLNWKAFSWNRRLDSSLHQFLLCTWHLLKLNYWLFVLFYVFLIPPESPILMHTPIICVSLQIIGWCPHFIIYCQRCAVFINLTFSLIFLFFFSIVKKLFLLAKSCPCHFDLRSTDKSLM